MPTRQSVIPQATAKLSHASQSRAEMQKEAQPAEPAESFFADQSPLPNESETAAVTDGQGDGKAVENATLPHTKMVRDPIPKWYGVDVAPHTKMVRDQKNARIQVTPRKGDTFFPNIVLDSLLPELEPAASLVYLRLYRLSHGFHEETCLVSYPALGKALNLGRMTVVRAIAELEEKGLIEKLETDFKGRQRGIRYRVWLPEEKSEAELLASDNQAPHTKMVPNKQIHDEIKKKDDLKQIISKQTAVENAPKKSTTVTKSETISEHQAITISAYENLTKQRWTKRDEQHYQKITHIPVKQIEQLMRTIFERAPEPIGSFAYFAKAMLSELALPKKQSLARLKKKYEKLASEIAATYVGANNRRPSDRIDALKQRCLQKGITWNNDLANEVLGL